MEIGETLKYVRTKKSMTQAELAKKSGLKEITIRKYESGERTPKFETLQKICSALDVGLEVFLNDKEINSIVEKIKTEFSNTKIEYYNPEPQTRIDDLIPRLNNSGKWKAADYIDDLLKIPEYRKDKD